jgi:ABC-type lipoprotein release transport system permease subunit
LAGTGLAALSTRWLSTQIFGVSLMDPATYVVALGVLVGAVLVATGLPAGRAAAVSPAETLRDG